MARGTLRLRPVDCLKPLERRPLPLLQTTSSHSPSRGPVAVPVLSWTTRSPWYLILIRQWYVPGATASIMFGRKDAVAIRAPSGPQGCFTWRPSKSPVSQFSIWSARITSEVDFCLKPTGHFGSSRQDTSRVTHQEIESASEVIWLTGCPQARPQECPYIYVLNPTTSDTAQDAEH
jgi:hypothetical protein